MNFAGAGTGNQAGSGNISYTVLPSHKPLRYRKKLVLTFPGKGLFVDYTDSADELTVQDVDSNHLWMFFVSNVPSAADDELKPTVNTTWRIWFTDE